MQDKEVEEMEVTKKVGCCLFRHNAVWHVFNFSVCYRTRIWMITDCHRSYGMEESLLFSFLPFHRTKRLNLQLLSRIWVRIQHFVY